MKVNIEYRKINRNKFLFVEMFMEKRMWYFGMVMSKLVELKYFYLIFRRVNIREIWVYVYNLCVLLKDIFLL